MARNSNSISNLRLFLSHHSSSILEIGVIISCVYLCQGNKKLWKMAQNSDLIMFSLITVKSTLIEIVSDTIMGVATKCQLTKKTPQNGKKF